ncbi:putative NmrA family transcriptional regulator [Lophiostoma macrostomum CBS 122681]|uniref:Putative NmrA family transcriptional regulator n=1 Tax=Lophiostoma macrostomum CBS 122681 TaxID=1314788 RepID=A0A6A6SVT7_9PLEO|nr:putative NmrA family transcriptional regulator [Lophiostoma macrostomum CBS 122681]
MTKLITVFGATGNQGGSVVRNILAHPQLSKEWKIRGVTRDPTNLKPDAQKLASQGVEFVKADLNSQPSILHAITGSTAVFGVTNYWETGSASTEIQQGKNLANACKSANVSHLIWSSLPAVSQLTNGSITNLHHFDSKAAIENYIVSIGLPASFVLAGFFMSNMPGGIRPTEDGTYAFSNLFKPDTRVPMIDIQRDYGKFAAACLADPDATLGKHIQTSSAWVTPVQVCEAVERVTGKKCSYTQMADEAFPMGEELRANMVLIRDWGALRGFLGMWGLGSRGWLEG